MSENKNILHKNANGDWHGYQQWYDALNRLYLRCIFKNGLVIGYEECHSSYFNKETIFYIR